MEWIQYVLLLYKFCEYLDLKYSVLFHSFDPFLQSRPHCQLHPSVSCTGVDGPYNNQGCCMAAIHDKDIKAIYINLNTEKEF